MVVQRSERGNDALQVCTKEFTVGTGCVTGMGILAAGFPLFYGIVWALLCTGD